MIGDGQGVIPGQGTADQPVGLRGSKDVPAVITWCPLCGKRFRVFDPERPVCPSCGAQLKSTSRRLLVYQDPADDGRVQVVIEVWHDGQVRVRSRRTPFTAWGRAWRLIREDRA